MTTEQNEPQAQPSQGQSQAPGGNPTQTPGQNPGHRRRRRKRNKGATSQGGGAPQGGKQPQTLTNPQQNGQIPVPNGQSTQASPTFQPQKPKPQKRFFPKNGGGGNNGNGNGSYGGQGNNGNGNGRMQGGGGSARRKGKGGRRQQVFVGPMDHSYRGGANGNIADNQGNSNGEFRGMPHSGFYSEEEYSPAPVIPIREDAPTRIYFFIEDLFFLAKIQEVSRKLGVKVGFLKADKETLTRLTEGGEEARPSLIVFDLNNVNAKPLTMIPKIKAKLKRGTSVIGFLSHLQGDLKVKATEAGCDMVMPRSAFSQNLPNLLRRHGLEEELEAVEA